MSKTISVSSLADCGGLPWWILPRSMPSADLTRLIVSTVICRSQLVPLLSLNCATEVPWVPLVPRKPTFTLRHHDRNRLQRHRGACIAQRDRDLASLLEFLVPPERRHHGVHPNPLGPIDVGRPVEYCQSEDCSCEPGCTQKRECGVGRVVDHFELDLGIVQRRDLLAELAPAASRYIRRRAVTTERQISRVGDFYQVIRITGRWPGRASA